MFHYFKKLIESFHQENSSLAANRFLKLQNTDARYRNKTLTDDFSSFKLNDYLSFSSFYKYIYECACDSHLVRPFLDFIWTTIYNLRCTSHMWPYFRCCGAVVAASL